MPYPADDPEYQKQHAAVFEELERMDAEARKEKEEAYRIYAQKRDYYENVARPAIYKVHRANEDRLFQQWGLPALIWEKEDDPRPASKE